MTRTPDHKAASLSWHDLAGAPQYLLIVDADLVIRFVSRLPAGEDDPTGRVATDFLPETYHGTLRHAVGAALEHARPHYFETETYGPGRARTRFSNWAVPLPAPNAGRVAIIAEDVTEHQRTARALETEKDLFRSLVADAPDHVMVVDREHRVHFVNRLEPGWSEEEVIGQVADGMVTTEFRERVHDAIEAVFESGESRSFDTQTPLADGTHWYSVRAGPIRQGDRVAWVSLVSTDVTEQVQRAHAREAEQLQLRQSEERFRTLVEYAPEAVVILDARTGGFVEANGNACSLFRLDREALLAGGGPLTLSPERQPDGALSSLAAMSRIQEALDGKHTVFEWTHVDADGRHLPCEVRLVLLPSTEAPLIRASILDISERKQAEVERERLTAELAQAQKLQAIGQLTGGIAHDFNNLLTVIMGSLEMIDVMPDCGPGIRNLSSQAIAAAGRAAALTQRLLAFARRQPLRPQVVDVNRLVVEAESLLRRTLGETIAIEISLGDGLWTCEIDPTQLENVMLNLAINARDAMPDGGHLRIETDNARLDEDFARHDGDAPPGDYVRLSVTDSGTGMSDAVLNQVFEPFFTTKEAGQGSGLGLSMVYGFVKQSRGHVHIRSAPGRGTTVYIYLPRSAAARQPALADSGEPASPDPQGQGQRILVVEDEPAVRVLVVKSLESLGYRTVDAPDARTAIAVLQGDPGIDLLLTDVVLPGGRNGPELARQARDLRPNLPVLFMSGYAESAMNLDGRVEPDIVLLEKPFTRVQLAQQVVDALARRPLTSQP